MIGTIDEMFKGEKSGTETGRFTSNKTNFEEVDRPLKNPTRGEYTLASLAATAIAMGQTSFEYKSKVYNVRKHTDAEFQAIMKNRRRRKLAHKARLIRMRHPHNGHLH